MSDIKITIPGGQSKRLKTMGLYCPDDIIVTAGDSGAGHEAVLEPLEVTENGVYSPPDGVDGFSPVSVNVPVPDGYIAPNGTKEVTENGTHDIREFESVEVNVPVPDGYITPSGILEITENGEYDVTAYAGVNIAVASGASGDDDLPAGYRRCDFIRFNDAQIVDTEVVPTNSTKIKVLYTRESSSAMYMYGVSSDGNTATVTAYLSSGGAWRFGDKSASRTITASEDIIHTAIVDKTGIVSDSGNTAFSASTFTAIGSLLIGANRNASGTVAAAQYIGRIFQFEMWAGSTQVLKLVPVTDGIEYRFFDTIGQKFHDSITSTPLDGGNL